MKHLEAGTPVVIARNLGRVVRHRKRGGAPGYDVQLPNGTLPHFCPDWCVKPAVLGVTVCAHPRGTHWCGLLHIPDPDTLRGGGAE